jgi:DNA-binding PadR family transcriptional regulator
METSMPRPARVTLADLVVLSMLAERPMHGYELWSELQRRQVHRWASITKPQVYYSLRKLDAAGHITGVGDDHEALGPERRVYKPGEDGRRLLANELAHARWATQQVPDPFLTWMVLSWHGRPRDFNVQITRRRRFIENQLEEARVALDSAVARTSSRSDATMIARLGVRRLELELEWLDDVADRMSSRAE